MEGNFYLVFRMQNIILLLSFHVVGHDSNTISCVCKLEALVDTIIAEAYRKKVASFEFI